jgi:outer membrane receptor protein involved in Fe transport
MPTHLDLHTLVLFNGRPIRESGFGGINFPVYMTFPISFLNSVEIIRGPGSVLYGTNAFTGVVNLKTRVPDHNEIEFSSMTGSYGYYESDVTAKGKAGEIGYVTAVRAAGQQGYTYGLTDGRGTFDSQSDKNRSVSGAAHLESRGLTFDVFATDMETFHLGSLPWWSLPFHEFGVKKLFTNVGYQLPLHDRVKLELNVTYNVHENRFANVTQTVGLNSSDILGEATLFVEPADNANLVFGFLQEQRSNYHPDGNYHVGGDVYQSVSSYRHEPKSFYAQGDYKFDKFLKLVAGTQWNKSSQGFADWISRYGIIVTPADKWGVKLLRGEAFRAPFALETDLYDVPILVGNKDLEPEKITTYDAQLFYNDEKTYAAVTYFDSTIEELIIRDTSVSPVSFKNGGCQRFRGIEFEAKYFFTPKWHILGSTTFQDNKQTTDLNPSTVPDYMAKLGTAYTWDWGTAALFYSYFSKPPRLASEVVVNPEPDAMNLLSFNLTIDPSRWLDIPRGRASLIFRVENIFDEEIYVPEFNRGGNPNSLPNGPGRTWFAGFKLSF